MHTDLHACWGGRKEVVLDMVVFTSLRAHLAPQASTAWRS